MTQSERGCVPLRLLSAANELLFWTLLTMCWFTKLLCYDALSLVSPPSVAVP